MRDVPFRSWPFKDAITNVKFRPLGFTLDLPVKVVDSLEDSQCVSCGFLSLGPLLPFLLPFGKDLGQLGISLKLDGDRIAFAI